MKISVTPEELAAGRGYEALFVPALFSAWPSHILNSVDIQTGAHVLDVACGTGVLSRHALAHVGPEGQVVAVDPAPGMLAAAQELESRIDWRLGRAEDLPVDANAFDAVLSQFGLMFFEDKVKALEEMHRALKPGGYLSLALWHFVDQNPIYGDIAALLDEQVSSAAGHAVRLPFCLGEPDAVADLVSQAGLHDIRFETKTNEARFPSTRTMVEAELRGWLPLFGINLSEDKIEKVLSEAEARLAPYEANTGEALFPTTAYIMTARKSERPL
ncbi:class I SAM-dependent methyltransferase [Roseovarius phycicola]|uniref:Methyltransferase domain-containing protein n=1 Tax=Roseovarius phycicola TaxID=3080976 RepID=A0ABZ2HKB7_9RHOB